VRLNRSTIKDVALAAGVTAGTVSRALRDDPRVIESTRKRILEAAQRLDYRPNLQARGLQTGRTGAVGLACPTGPWILVHPYFTPIHAGFTSEAAKDGVRVLLYMPPGDATMDLEANNVQARALLDGRVDGGLIYQAQCFSPETLQNLQEMGMAVVLMDTDVEIPGFFQIMSNAEQRIRESLGWAHELGARRVGILGLSAGTPFNEVVRLGVESARLPMSAVVQEIRHSDPYHKEALDAAMDALIAEKPDAVILNRSVHVGHFLRRQEEGSLPGGIPLFYFGGSHQNKFLAYPGVHYLETDLWAAGRNAYLMFKEAQERKPTRSERLVWIRRP
jgi:DNA-binding LacI/PurR family transcriptional regulator